MTDSVESLYRVSRVSEPARELYANLVRDHVASCSAARPGRDADLLGELAEEDWIALDDEGRVSVLYPFSLKPTGISVQVEDCLLYAMCAIDALGIRSMLGQDVTIEAVCPESGETLTISAGADGSQSSIPENVAVLRRRQGGAAHLSRCEATRFFKTAQDAEKWRETQGQPADVVLSLDEAMQEATAIFGRTLSDGVRLVISA